MGIGELLLVVGASCLAVDAFSPPCPTFSAIRPRSLARGLECRRIPLRPSTGTGCLADLEPRRLAALNQQKKQAPDFIVEDAKVAEKRLSEQQVVAPTKVREVVCDDLHGICVLKDEVSEEQSWIDVWKPRLLLSAVCIAYGSNFACGSIMTETMTPSVAAGLRFSVAALALSPFLPQLDRALLRQSVTCSLFIASAYIGQLIALQSVSAGKVGFLCSLSVVVCPLLEVLLDGKPLSRNVLASIALAIAGVAALELGGGGGAGQLALERGDLWALFQPIGFGVGYFLTERILKARPEQALPVTAVQTATVGGCSLLWMAAAAAASASAQDPATLLSGVSEHPAALAAVLYTGVVTTALTRIGETLALKSMSSSDASVVMTTEPVWAASWAWLLQGDTVGANALAGGGLIMAACAANFAPPPADFAPPDLDPLQSPPLSEPEQRIRWQPRAAEDGARAQLRGDGKEESGEGGRVRGAEEDAAVGSRRR